MWNFQDIENITNRFSKKNEPFLLEKAE